MGDWFNTLQIITITNPTHTLLSGQEQCCLRFTYAGGGIKLFLPLDADLSFPSGSTFEIWDDTGTASGGIVIGGPGFTAAGGGTFGGVTVKSLGSAFRSAGDGAGMQITRTPTTDRWWLAGALIV